MNVITLPQKQYKALVRRQDLVEEELAILRAVIKEQAEDDFIRPSVLKRWEQISRDLDRDKGRVFRSRKEIKSWFRNLQVAHA